MHVQVRVLGPTDVVGDQAPIQAASAPKVRRVLAVLAVARGDSVHRATLADVLWPDGEPPSASKTIQTYVWTLRRTLGAHAIITDGPQYRLGPDVGLDVSEFEAAVAEARDTLSDGRACDAVEGFDRALGLWRGPALVDVLDWAAGQAEAARLEELRRYAEELRGEALVSCHPDGAAIGDLEHLARSEPLRERRWELLVGALTRAGRATEAVRAVRRAREHLAESGLEVGPALRSLELVALVPHAVEEQPANTSLEDVAPIVLRPGEGHGRLPRSRTRLVGRDLDVAAAEAALATRRIVTVTGVGGVGKTRVALAVVERVKVSFPDGVCWIDLAPVRAEDDTIAAIAAALEVRPRLGVALVDQVAAALGDRRELLALDNCEQVVASVRSAVATLVECCPQLCVLATSRERIGVDGEWIVALAPLATDGRDSPAVELLADRIEAYGGDRTEMPVLVDIAQRVDGLPLALELVAGRCRTLGAAEVVARLDDEPWLLTDRTVPEERHQTLEAVLTWSYELLSDVERDLLQRLSVFASSFTLAAAERVAADIVGRVDDVDDLDASAGVPARVDEAVASLVERSLLERRGDRFRLLETTRQFAARHLARSSHERAVQAQHTAYVVDRTREIHDGLHGPNEADWVTTLDHEWPDVRVVMRRALADDDADTVIDLVVHLTFEAFWRRPEAFAWIRTAVDRYRDRPGPHRHELLGAGSFVAWTLLDVPSGVELAEAALAARPATGPSLDAIPQAAAAGAYFFAGRADLAMEIVEQEMENSATAADRWSIAQLACSYATAVAIFDGDRAGPVSARAVRLASALANPSLIAYALAIEAQVLMRQDVEAATATLERARAAAELVRNRWLLTVIINNTGTALHTASGRLDDALVAYLAAADEAHRTGWTVHAWVPVWSAAACLHTLGRIDEAALFTGACQASGNLRFPMPGFPPDLDMLISGEGEPRPLALYELGTHIDLPELIRIASGQQPMPDVPRYPTVTRTEPRPAPSDSD